MNIKNRISDAGEKMVLVGWWPIIQHTNFMDGIFPNFEIILGGINADNGEEVVCLSLINCFFFNFPLGEWADHSCDQWKDD